MNKSHALFVLYLFVMLVVSQFGFVDRALLLTIPVPAYFIITQTRLCNILQYFTAVKKIIFR